MMEKEFHLSRNGKDTIKNYPDSFRDTILKKELDSEGINNLIICGAITHNGNHRRKYIC